MLLCIILAGGAALGYSEHQHNQYSATASLVFANNELSQEIAGIQATGNSDPQLAQATNAQLVGLGDTPAVTARILGHGLTRTAILDSITISPLANTNIVEVTAVGTSAARAAAIANTYASSFVSNVLAQQQGYVERALRVVDAQLSQLPPKRLRGALGQALESRAQALAVLEQAQAGQVRVAQSAVLPASPSSPLVLRNAILGAFLGMLLGLTLAFALDRLDRRITESEDLEEIFGIPVLGEIVESSAIAQHQKATSKTDGPRSLPARDGEAFHLLRGRLRYFNVDRQVRLVLVTSAASGDGKSTVVQNLGEAAALGGERVLLVDADLRRASLAKRFGVPLAPGLTECLTSATSVESAVRRILPNRESKDVARGGSLDLLSAGALPPNPFGLMQSEAMHRLLIWAAESYDLVLIDAPPPLVVSDAMPLLQLAHGVIVVSWVGRDTRELVRRTRDELRHLNAPVLGVVANGLKAAPFSAYYTNDPASENPATASGLDAEETPSAAYASSD